MTNTLTLVWTVPASGAPTLLSRMIGTPPTHIDFGGQAIYAASGSLEDEAHMTEMALASVRRGLEQAARGEVRPFDLSTLPADDE